MSVLFGMWNVDGRPTRQDYLDRVTAVLAPYGPDGCTVCSDGSATIIYRPFHTTRESRSETQPYRSKSGAIVTWDGRLDNRRTLLDQLHGAVPQNSPDVAIVAAAFDRWETDCFAKLVGDWAVAIVNPRTRSVLLAKDFIGTRHLHYFVDEDHVAWSTALDPLVWLSGRSSALCEEYIAGWFSYLPAAHLTPYTGIHCVPPSSFVLLSAHETKVQKYWDFDPRHKIRYATDAEYEDHFRGAFCEAVRRRLRCDRPILAELSGGMDSSSIVCVADGVMSSGDTEAPRLDTLSYYDDSEPNWNERPYFSKVEEKRGCIGCHIDLSGQDFSLFDHDNRRFVVTPGSGRETLSELTKQLTAWMSSHGNRVVLSGIGGDEVTGGVPAPIPELQDLIVRLRLTRLAACLKVWALQKRKPWLHLLVESLRPFLSPDWVGMPKHKHPPQWLAQEFVKRNHSALHGYYRRLELCGAMPSFQENMATLEGLRRQFACDGLSSEPLCERRYPFLDRDLLEFLYAIPRQQLVRPGQRRSLMRRALVGIVPEEILNRKRKAFVSRGPMTKLSDQWPRLLKLSEEMVGGSLGVVDAGRFREVLNQARQGVEVPTVALLRTLEIEYWLQGWDEWRHGKDDLGNCGVVHHSEDDAVTRVSMQIA